MYMFFDFIVSKMVFRFRHVIFHLVVGLGYLALYAIGQSIITDGSKFPLPKNKFYNEYTPIGFVAIVIIHAVFTTYTKIRWNRTKDPKEFGEDTEVENIVKKYKKYIKKRANDIRESLRASAVPIDLKTKDLEFMFIREVIYNYLDLEVDRKRIKWDLSSHKRSLIEGIPEIKEESMERSESVDAVKEEDKTAE